MRGVRRVAAAAFAATGLVAGGLTGDRPRVRSGVDSLTLVGSRGEGTAA